MAKVFNVGDKVKSLCPCRICLTSSRPSGWAVIAYDGDTRLYTVDEKFRGEYMQFAENYLEKI